MPPTITLKQAKGFSLFMLRAVFSGRGCAVIEPEPTLCADEAKPDVKGNGNERAINEALAEIMAKHPKSFGAIATLPGKMIDGSLSEMEYALDTLKLDGLSVPALLTSRSRPCSSICDGVARANPKHYFCPQSNLSFGEISVQTNLRPQSVEERSQDRAAASPFLCDRDACNDTETHVAFQST